MIYEINNKNIEKIKNTFLDESYLLKELNSNPFAKIIVLENDGEIIGYLYYSDIYERAEINNIEIKKENRNCGNGDLLIKELINIVKKDITLEVKIDNIFAIKLYEKNGFVKKAIRKNYYKGIDGILMERNKDSY